MNEDKKGLVRVDDNGDGTVNMRVVRPATQDEANMVLKAVVGTMVGGSAVIASTEFGCHPGCTLARFIETAIEDFKSRVPEEAERTLRLLRDYLEMGPVQEEATPDHKHLH